jgi:hypothetical protein
MNPLPLPELPISTTRRQDFAHAQQMLFAARKAFDDRANPIETDRLYSIGFSVGLSCGDACRMLAAEQGFWCGVCVRGFLEYAVRLLWAAQRADGMKKLMAYYDHAIIKGTETLSKVLTPDPTSVIHTPEFESRKKFVLKDANRATGKLHKVFEEIWEVDAKDFPGGIFTDDAEEHSFVLSPLHQQTHINPNWLGQGNEGYVSHASRSYVHAMMYCLRAVGYRLGWDQKEVVAKSLSFSYVDEEGRKLIQGIKDGTAV